MRVIRLGDLTINPNISTVIINSEEMSIDPKMFQLLMLFCENPRQIVTRQQILDTIWENSIVTDNAVNKLVANLRKILQDDTKAPKYIQTVHKRGYRLVQPVQFEPEVEQGEKPLEVTNSSNKLSLLKNQLAIHKSFWAKVLLALLLALLALLLWERESTKTQASKITLPEKVAINALTRMPGLERTPLINPEQEFIVFLREDLTTGHRSVWYKDLVSENTVKLQGISPYIRKLIDLEKQDSSWQLMYLIQERDECTVNTVSIRDNRTILPYTPLFSCAGMQIVDTAYAKKRRHLYYTAIRPNESKARIYRFDLNDQSHSLLLQPEVIGMGNRGIDLSPDEDKLLIVQVGKDYKSQIYQLDLINNELLPGFTAQHSIIQATWAYDAEQIMFFSQFPARQIIVSDLHGSGKRVLVDLPEYIEAEFSRVDGSQDIIFSTINRDFNIRWIDDSGNSQRIKNSTVYDTRPALTHGTFNYAFISTRTGERQLFFADLADGSHRKLGHLAMDRSLKTLSFSPDDQFLLTADSSHVWLIDVKEQLRSQGTIDLSPEFASVSTTGNLVAATWLNNEYLYYKVKENSRIKGYVFNLKEQFNIEVDSRWKDLVTDHNAPDTLYLVDKNDFQLYQMPLERFVDSIIDNSVTFSTRYITASYIHLPASYLNIKIHGESLYFLTTSDEGNAQGYNYQIQVLSSGSVSNEPAKVYSTRCSCGFDVSDSGFIVSELTAIEGDVYRTNTPES